MNPLRDKDFLFDLYQQRSHEIYARIIALTFDERPIEQIEGKVTSGSVNIDAASAVRRTCNLTLLAHDVKINNYYWGVSNKFKLEIGIKNSINPSYPNIIWFKQGLYVITTFNSSLSTSGHTISISGKDKMCLLNGDISGNLPASIDFGQIDTYNKLYTKIEFGDKKEYEASKYYILEDDKYILSLEEYDPNETYYTRDNLLEREDLSIKDIIRESVRVYGKEEYHNIVINDLDEFGLELMEYRGNKDLFLLYDEDAAIYTNMTYDENLKVGDYELKNIPPDRYNTAVNKLNDKRYIFTWTTRNKEEKRYSVTKLKTGDVAGYRTTDLTYAGQLISSVGESLTSILDKIKNMLGAFEYFYDLDGRFVFQASRVYQNKSWNTLQNIDGDVFARDAVEESPYEFSFDNSNLITAFQNAAAINEIKNDYSVHGVRKGITGDDILIHARYAISKKPQYYKSFDGTIYIGDKSILDDLKQHISNEIKITLLDKVINFEPSYTSSLPVYLDKPIKQVDGSWSPGWWDIRDWHDYYVLIKQEEPMYSMKEYSKNNMTGCQPVKDFMDTNSTSYAWLIIIDPDRPDKVILTHGSGNPTNSGKWCIRYRSEYLEDGSLFTYYVDTKGNKKSNYISAPREYLNENTPEARQAIANTLDISLEDVIWFIPPYSGCSNDHTYLEFLEGDIKQDGNYVYFYNPNFPGTTSFEEVIKDQVEKNYNDKIEKGEIKIVDWRELIYQMAKDYYKHNQEPSFLNSIINNNKKIDDIDSYYPTGKTGYEIFYSDMQAFWRQLYDINPEIIYDYEGGKYQDEKVYSEDGVTYTIETNWIPYRQLDTFSCDYYLDGESDEQGNYSREKKYWHKNVDQAPELLNFWIDFFDNADSLSQYSIQAIGDRPKVVNNSKITSIYFRNVPQVILCRPEDYQDLNIKPGYTYIHVSNLMGDLFTISARGKSAEEEINELFYNHSCCAENITITSIPVYHLEPNTLIYVNNKENSISGKFKIQRISLPLNYNGTMTITASKVIDPIY